ncbi:MAG: arylsulfatase B [Planctomycetota bacterium]|jgi:arylsulfatase A-like enzyme
MRTHAAITIIAAALLSGPGTSQDRKPTKPPHIVFFLADDLGWKDVGFHGSEIKTPNIDKLAKAGTRLEQFYVQQVCSPTRAAFLTGRYPIRTGLQMGVIRPWEPWGLGLDEKLLPQVLKEAGYVTAICGKWHLGLYTREYLPTSRGFDHQYGHYCGAIDYFKHDRGAGKDWNRDDKPLDEKGYSTELIGKEAVRLIQDHDLKKPLFLYVAFNAPHTPLQAPERYIEMYESIRNQRRRTFAAMVTCLDETMGKVLAALDDRGMRDDTLIVFTSDNGGPSARAAARGGRAGPGAANNAPLRGRKGNLYEGGVRVPTVVCWPGKLQAGAIVNEPLHIVDMLPTLARLAGGSTAGTKPLDGKDAWATIADGKPSPHKEILLNANNLGGAIRVGDWKLVVREGRAGQGRGGQGRGGQGRRRQGRRNRRPATTTVELFNLAEDPNERNDLAKEYPDRVADLRTRLGRYKNAGSNVRRGKRARPAGFQTPKRWGHPDKKDPDKKEPDKRDPDKQDQKKKDKDGS